MVFINQQEYQTKILNTITSGEFKEIIKNMQNGEDPIFKDGFIQGMAWASILTSQVTHYTTVNTITDGDITNDSDAETRTGTENSSSEA